MRMQSIVMQTYQGKKIQLQKQIDQKLTKLRKLLIFSASNRCNVLLQKQSKLELTMMMKLVYFVSYLASLIQPPQECNYLHRSVCE